MPGNEQAATGSGEGGIGRQQERRQQPREQRAEGGGTPSDGHASPPTPIRCTSPQVTFPFSLGALSPLARTSQLQALLLQQQAEQHSRARSHSPKPKTPPSGPVEPRKSVIAQFRALFVNGVCRWPGCEEVFEEYPHFLRHLHSEHSPGERSLAQCRVQQDMVRHMENQLTLEKQKLLAMQLHLSAPAIPILSSPEEDPEGPHSLLMDSPQSQVADGAPYCSSNEAAEVVKHGYGHLMPEIIPSIECYKYNNIRPPFTYASLIRWAILESPEKQMSLNQIYHWFTRMFFYFRHNTSTWKNAVRHNLSLHRCFVRVEKGKGAVWTVDEAEFQKRKGQKFTRDHGVGYLTPYTFCPPQSWTGGLPEAH
ncbi:forkhead box protein P3 isoform X2 [Anguilla anguilla]|uniref:forkhead box protein P3 isoform X2 n=1 Tax=Anguilla anguilla TaxID=7936 RepID=UPI0015AE147B|nr:forkhead box protein P3 isoform X2 [Anguilla anguilla]